MTVRRLILPTAICATLLAVVAWNRETFIASQPKKPERLAKHAQLYKEYAGPKKLGVDVGTIHITAMPVARQPVAGGLPEFLRQRYCAADAVIEGVVETKDAAFTEEKSFIFSDQSVRVSRLFRNATSSPIAEGSAVTITRPGGEMASGRGDNKKLRALDDSFPPLEIGQTYVMFLKHVPSTDSFKTVDPDGVYLQSNNRVKYLGPVPPLEVVGIDSDQFVATLGGITKNMCEGGK